ncbi:MAG TPA: phosphoribosylformylglycinamidine synthase subunit PurL [Firmicutes bacterium]|nr:phosphoribosylformylglycinamidine synthase subunit PurL [Bacillota bacterium]
MTRVVHTQAGVAGDSGAPARTGLQTEAPWRRQGLTDAEYARIVELLGRHPNELELGMFAVLWSEHCGYKHSKRALRRFPTRGPQVLVGPGENAGVVDIGESFAVAFRMESHNHPCAIEPYQGAATGVGGIIRDILAMGARPVALLDSLRFGPPSEPRSAHIARGVVEGIAGYGNCVGVPTVGGEIAFDPAYAGNPLCNVLCVGLIEKERLTRAAATGVGNVCILVGQHTGRDGIHGATFASVELDAESESRRPSVQVGDPFMEKLLIEACLEIVERGLAVGIQDLGAAGLTSSLAETAGRGGTGVDVEVEAVPQRETGMTPYEVMLSESQERMLVIARPENVPAIKEICYRWGLNAAVVGRVTGDGLFTVRWHGQIVGQVPVRLLTEETPVYDPEAKEPAYLAVTRQAAAVPAVAAGVAAAPAVAAPATLTGEPEDSVKASPRELLLRLLASPTVASKAWAYRRYDHQVQTRTAILPGAGDAALLVLRETGMRKGIALATDGNGRLCYLDPRRGGRLAVAEAARNVACVGARPIAITNCLNFGNPEDPEIFWQFKEAIEGMSEAAEALGTPVTGGNVSFYNESERGAIFPTPVVGMLGVTDRPDLCRGMAPGRTGQRLLLLGAVEGPERPDEVWAGSELQALLSGAGPQGVPADVDLALEKRLQDTLLKLYEAGVVEAAHDVSEGGLAVAVAEMLIAAAEAMSLAGAGNPSLGADVTLPGDPRLSPLTHAFGEWPSRVIVAVDPGEAEARAVALLEASGLPWIRLGEITGRALLTFRLPSNSGSQASPGEMPGETEWFSVSLDEAWKAYSREPFGREE